MYYNLKKHACLKATNCKEVDIIMYNQVITVCLFLILDCVFFLNKIKQNIKRSM
jgi:hypothetical protein